MSNNIITVTSPMLPPLEEFVPYLERIWDNKWITNNGEFHQQLEKALCEYLGVEYLSLFTNGTLPLITALQAMQITGGMGLNRCLLTLTLLIVVWTQTR